MILHSFHSPTKQSVTLYVNMWANIAFIAWLTKPVWFLIDVQIDDAVLEIISD